MVTQTEAESVNSTIGSARPNESELLKIASSSIDSCQEFFKEIWTPDQAIVLNIAGHTKVNMHPLTKAQCNAVFAAFACTAFEGIPMISVAPFIDPAVEDARMRLVERFNEGSYQLHHGIFDGSKIIGWSFGQQERPTEYHMVNTGIHPDCQNKGIYSSFLPQILETLRFDGFDSVYSWHLPTNIGVLLPKMKAGFVHVGTEMWPRFGLLDKYSKHLIAEERQVFNYRIGEARAPGFVS